MLRTKSLPFAPVLLVVALIGGGAHAELVSGINAIVHDSVITYGEVRRDAEPAIETARRQFQNDRTGFMDKVSLILSNSLETLVERQLVLHDFQTSGYNLPESIIDENIQEIIHNEYGDRKTLTKTLQARGTTYEKYRQEMRDRIIVTAMRSKHVGSELIISPHKIEQYYAAHTNDYHVDDQVKLRMIVLNKSTGTDEQPRKLADDIETKLKEGASFSEMATVYSQGSQRGQGGDWGWGDRSTLRKELADVAFKLKPGEISPVIETKGACFIMQVEEIKPAHIRPLSEVRDDIEKNLLINERARLAAQYITKLKKKTFIRYF